MRTLLRGSTAYKIFSRDAANGTVSHAGMLCFGDGAYLRFALKYFALALFSTDESRREGSLIMGESFSDVKIYPAEGKKPSVSDADDILADSVLRPLEGDKKLYIFTDFDQAMPVVQNKLLKLLEDPPQGVYLLLGATSLAPVLPTILSRVRLLEIPPFPADAVAAALKRQGSEGDIASLAAASCGGIFGEAEAMLSGGWFSSLLQAARDICSADTLARAGEVSLKYAEVREKTQLLKLVQRIYFDRLKACLSSPCDGDEKLCRPALLYAVSAVNGALEDVRFNANFSSLLFTLVSRIITENDKWKKLLA